MKLAIISHTEHYKTSDGTIVGWGPTINEINHLLAVFDEIYHVAMLQKTIPPPSALPYTSDRIKFIPIPVVGGRHYSSKLNTIFNAPKTIHIVSNTLKKVDAFQLRTPTGIGVYLIPYLTLFVRKKGWFKYAGNWNQKKAPLGYTLQRFMLKHQRRIITINGQWENQPKQCLTFENPCLTSEDLALGEVLITKKIKLDSLSFCYVGRLEKEKGVERIIKAFINLPDDQKLKIGKVHLVGSGSDFEYFKKLANENGVDFNFHGFLSRDKVFEVYRASNIFLMPTTASEGFPKVIAEAMNFGCIPVVSNISSIGQYINETNGFIIDPITTENLIVQLRAVLKLTIEDYHKLIINKSVMVYKFSFDYYNERIKSLLKDL